MCVHCHNLKTKISTTFPALKTKTEHTDWIRKSRDVYVRGGTQGHTSSQQLEEPEHNLKVDVTVSKHLKQKGREENLVTGGRLLHLLGILQKTTVTSNRLG